MNAKKPVIVCGQGALISKASDELLEFATYLQIPIATTTPGKGAIAENHPLSLRVIGARGGMEYANNYVSDADLVFFIGSNTDSCSTDGWKLYKNLESKTFIHLDISGVHVGNSYPLKLSLVGDAKSSLEYMNEVLKTEYKGLKRDKIDLSPMKKEALDRVFNSKIEMPKGTVSPVKLSQILDEMLPENAIVTAEPGVSAIYPSALLSLKKAGRGYLTNYSMGALGYSVPAGLGASFASSNSPIISFTGDGSLGFVLGDLETIKRSGKNITIILTRNDTFGWIRGEAILLDDVNEPMTTDFGSADYVKIAEGFGFDSVRVKNEDDIKSALEKAIAFEGASFIEIMVPSEDKITPFVPVWVEAAKKKGVPYYC